MKFIFPFAHSVFMKIAEPRVIRIMQFGIYACMIFAGVGIITHPPTALQGVIGVTLVYIFGFFILFGALLGMVAVLPGIWWLERTGILSLSTAMLMYVVITLALGSSAVALAIPIALLLNFAQRWMEIRRFQLAPKVPKETR